MRGQHAQRQHVDLHQAQRVDVVLVPLDEGAVLHGGVADRHGLVQPPLGQDEAADVLRQVAREARAARWASAVGAADLRVVGIEPGLADVLVGHAVAPAAPDRVGQRGGDVLGQAQRLADLADRHARAVVDDGGADGGAVAAVALVDVLHHLLAPLVLEVDVDVRRLAALLGDEALEQQVLVLLGRIDRGDAQAEADHGIGRRAAPLAEDALLARPADDVVHGQEVVGVVRASRSARAPCRAGPAHLLRHAVADSARRAPAQVRSRRCWMAVLPGGTGSSGYS